MGDSTGPSRAPSILSKLNANDSGYGAAQAPGKVRLPLEAECASVNDHFSNLSNACLYLWNHWLVAGLKVQLAWSPLPGPKLAAKAPSFLRLTLQLALPPRPFLCCLLPYSQDSLQAFLHADLSLGLWLGKEVSHANLKCEPEILEVFTSNA